jgi:hypothetical protein
MFHEPLTLYCYLAAITQRFELVSGVIVLPQRQAALVAKQAAEVDVLSGGRLRLGVGIGWNAVEYEALGAGKRFESARRLFVLPLSKPNTQSNGSVQTSVGGYLTPLRNQVSSRQERCQRIKSY